MVSLGSLVAPIFVSAIFVFVVSSAVHMALKYHQKDVRGLPREAEITENLRRDSLVPGLYIFPYCGGHKEMRSPEMMEKYNNGPVGFLTILPSGPPNMGKYLGLWFGYCLLVAFFTAYLAGRALAAGTPDLQVFRVASTAAFFAYGLGPLADSIWKGLPWSNTARAVFDGLLYSLASAGAFVWLWPR